jgi:hypothetical protein
MTSNYPCYARSELLLVKVCRAILHDVYAIYYIYFLRFPARVAVPTGETGVTLLEGVLGLEASCNEPDDEDSKLNLKREERDGVEGAVTLNVVMDAEKDLRCLPRLPAGDGEKAALPRKLMLSMDT